MKKERGPSGKTEAAPLPVRAHHFLCAAGFRGKGYSKAFVREMWTVTERLRREPGLRLRIVDTCDGICDACPHQQGGACVRREEGEAVEKRDRRVAELLGLSIGSELAVGEVYARIARKLEEGIGIDALCGRCEWRGYPFCAKGLDEVRTGRFFTEREEKCGEEDEKGIDCGGGKR